MGAGRKEEGTEGKMECEGETDRGRKGGRERERISLGEGADFTIRPM